MGNWLAALKRLFGLEETVELGLPPDPSKIDVFIAHSSADQKMVDFIKEKIEEAGYTTYCTPGSMGPRVIESMTEGVQNSTILLGVFSPNFDSSKWPNREVALADVFNKKFLAVSLVEGYVPRFKSFAAMADVNRLDGSSWNKLKSCMPTLLRFIRELLEEVRQEQQSAAEHRQNPNKVKGEGAASSGQDASASKGKDARDDKMDTGCQHSSSSSSYESWSSYSSSEDNKKASTARSIVSKATRSRSGFAVTKRGSGGKRRRSKAIRRRRRGIRGRPSQGKKNGKKGKAGNKGNKGKKGKGKKGKGKKGK